MVKSTYPIAARYPAEMSWSEAYGLLSPAMQQQLLSEIQTLIRIEYQVLAAQQVISHIDLHAAAIVTDTIQMAELLKLMQGWSPELEDFDHIRRQQYFHTMHELVGIAQAHVLAQLIGR